MDDEVLPFPRSLAYDLRMKLDALLLTILLITALASIAPATANQCPAQETSQGRLDIVNPDDPSIEFGAPLEIQILSVGNWGGPEIHVAEDDPSGELVAHLEPI